MGLQIFYDKLRETTETYIQGKRRFEEFSDSCLLYLTLGMKKNARNKIVKSSSIDKIEVSSLKLNELKDLGFVREIENSGKFEITANGIWEIEKNLGVTISDIINCIESERFNFDTTSPMDYKEKIIIFSMICGRAFSDENQVDLINGDVSENWKTILDHSFQKLSELGVIKESQKKWEVTLHKRKGTDPPLSHLFQHTDALTRKVNTIFKAPGDRKYYLHVMDGGEVDLEKLSYLFKKVFGEIMDLSNVDEIVDHCKDVFVRNSNVLYKDGSKFSHPRYDLSVKEAAEKVVFSL